MNAYIGRCSGKTNEILSNPVQFYNSENMEYADYTSYANVISKCKGDDVAIITIKDASPLISEWIKFINDDLGLACTKRSEEEGRVIFVPRDQHNKISFDLTIDLLRYVFSERNTILKDFKWLKDTFKFKNPVHLLQLCHYRDTFNYVPVVDNTQLMDKEVFTQRLQNKRKYSTLWSGKKYKFEHKIIDAIKNKNDNRLKNLCQVRKK